MWANSASCAGAFGVMAIVDLASAITVKDSIYGPATYSPQLNLVSADNYEVQLVLQFQPGGPQIFKMESSENPGEAITDAAPGNIFQTTINQAPTNRQIVGFTAGGGFLLSVLGNVAMLWPRMNGTLQGTPIYQQLPFSRQYQSASLDIVGFAEGSQAVFSPGTAFNVQLKLEGITDATYAGIDGEVGGDVYTPPTLCGGRIGLNTGENSNLIEDLLSVDPQNGFYQLVYNA